MKRWVICFLMLAFLAATGNADLTMSSDSVRELPIQVSSRQIEPNCLSLSLDLAQPGWAEVGSEENPVEVAEILNTGFVEEEGQPVVPVTGRMFRVPPRSGVYVEVVSAEYETYSNIEYAAFYGEGRAEELDQVAVESDTWFPGNLAEVSAPVGFHDFRISTLSLYPVQVNSYRDEVRVYSNIDVRIHFEGTDERGAIDAWPTKISSTYLPWYEMFLDWDENELDEFELYRGNVQVIMRNLDPIWETLQPWIDWKRQKGWELEFLTDDDVNSWTANNIINELRDRWDSTDEKFDYIVIVGDGQGNFSVPAGPTRSLGDYAYTLMTDGDEFQDCAVGRISVNSTNELNEYVHKVFRYERDPYMEETYWYLHGAVMGVSHYSGISTYLVGHYWRTELFNLGFTQVDTAFSVNAEPARGQSINHINAGVSFYNFRGGIDDGLQVNDINNLENDHMLFVCCDVTCVTGDWANSTSISEAYMRAGSVNTPTGGICGMGMATATTNTGRNNTVSGGLAFTMLRQRLPELGQGFFGSKVALYNNYGEHEFNRFREFSEMFNLMGDPTVWIWTAIPETLVVESPESISIGENSLTVTVYDQEGNPKVGSWVTLWKVDDDDDVTFRGITDENGTVTLYHELRNEGDAVLTVTHQNFQPYQLDIPLTAAETLVGHDGIIFQDDGENGTSGNDNGIPEAGETVGLVVTAKNYGNATENNIVLSATSDDIWVTNVTGTINFGSIEAGQTSTSDDIILVELAPETQHDWIDHLELTFSTDAGDYVDDFIISVQAPQFAFVSVDGVNDFDPGENTNINIEVMNVGGSDATASTGVLTSLDPFLSVGIAEADFDAIDIDDTEESGEFLIASHPETFPGHVATAELVITSTSGQVDTVIVRIPIGDRSPSDPCGPDKYGYYAFDNIDTGYELAPEYNWIEINPDDDNDYPGEELDINDNGNNQDESVVIDLPFTIQYYGQEFDQATICSNGWMAMGNEGWFINMRNFTIPSPLGPHNMIAPYWDERVTTGGGAIYYYYDEDNGRIIVQWDALPDQNNNAPCTFEVIIYDQVEGHLTYTHDAEILFQYGPVQHTTGPMGGHGTVPYYTTGIENEAQDDGLLYSYWDFPEPGANTVVNGRAILFTTNVALITGNVEGHVYDVETNQPLEGAVVRTSDYVFFTNTDAEGYFYLEEVVVGVHDFVAECIGYNDAISFQVEVFEDQTSEVNFDLRHPEFSISPEEIYLEIPINDSDSQIVSLTNDGNGPLDYSFKVLFNDPTQPAANELDDPWDFYNQVDLDPSESRYRGVTYMNDEFWLAGSNNADAGYNKLYRYSKEGLLRGVYDQPVTNHSVVGFYALTNDGTYLYGCDRGYLYQMEFVGNRVEVVNRFRITLNNVRYITYDSNNDWVWLGESEELAAYNLEGDNVHYFELENEFDPKGLGFYADDPDGIPLYFICQNSDQVDYYMRKFNPFTGALINVYAFDGPGTPLASDISNHYNPLLWTYISVMDDNDDFLNIWEIDLNTRWIDIDPQVGSVDAGTTGEVEITVFTNSLPAATYNAWLELKHNSIEQVFIMPIEIDVVDGQGVENHFVPVEPTEEEYVVIVNDLFLNGENINQNAEIGVFDGDLCVGAVVLDQNLPYAVNAIASVTIGEITLPGFTSGNPITFKVWDAIGEEEYEATADYVHGDGTFGCAPYTEVSLIAPEASDFTVQLRENYFELISFNIRPFNLDAMDIFGSIENMEITYNNEGSIVVPPDMNTIGDISLNQGYQIFCSEASEISIIGSEIETDLEYSLSSNQWNWLGYPFDFDIPVDVALADIADQVVILLNNDGEFWVPGLYNTISNLEPGRAYFVFVNEDITVQYQVPAILASGEEAIEVPVVDDAPTATGLPWPVLVSFTENLSNLNPAFIELYDGQTMVGKAQIIDASGLNSVVAWEGSETHDLSGFAAGNNVNVVVKDEQGNKISVNLVSEPITFRKGAYGNLTLDTVPLPTEFAVEQGYPNPFNPSVTVPFAIPQSNNVSIAVFNILGQEVYSSQSFYEAGFHRFTFNTSLSGQELVSGMYFLQVKFQGQSHIQKLMLLK